MKLFSLFRQKTPPPSSPTPVSSPQGAPVSSASSLQPITLRVLLIVFNPTVEPTTGKKLLEFMHWNKVEDLTRGYISDIQQASGGLVQHQIVERIDVDAFPAKVDGYVYDARTFLNVLRDPSRRYMPQEVDYYAIIHQFNILKRVANNEIDEVWTFNFPHAGFYESIMGGPDAFWCNAPPLQHTEASKRRFVIMGFSFERGVGEMLEDMGHRAESIMTKVFEHTHGDDNLWQRFIRYDKTHPGKSACGNVHFAPNSVRDYDWGNPSVVVSECDDWLYNFPNFEGMKRNVTAKDWGSGDIRKHHVWWLSHFPKTVGEKNGISYNWWQYIADPNRVNV